MANLSSSKINGTLEVNSNTDLKDSVSIRGQENIDGDISNLDKGWIKLKDENDNTIMSIDNKEIALDGQLKITTNNNGIDVDGEISNNGVLISETFSNTLYTKQVPLDSVLGYMRILDGKIYVSGIFSKIHGMMNSNIIKYGDTTIIQNENERLNVIVYKDINEKWKIYFGASFSYSDTLSNTSLPKVPLDYIFPDGELTFDETEDFNVQNVNFIIKNINGAYNSYSTMRLFIGQDGFKYYKDTTKPTNFDTNGITNILFADYDRYERLGFGRAIIDSDTSFSSCSQFVLYKTGASEPEINAELNKNMYSDSTVDVISKIEENIKIGAILGSRPQGDIEDGESHVTNQIWYSNKLQKYYKCLIDNTDITVETTKWKELNFEQNSISISNLQSSIEINTSDLVVVKNNISTNSELIESNRITTEQLPDSRALFMLDGKNSELTFWASNPKYKIHGIETLNYHGWGVFSNEDGTLKGRVSSKGLELSSGYQNLALQNWIDGDNWQTIDGATISKTEVGNNWYNLAGIGSATNINCIELDTGNTLKNKILKITMKIKNNSNHDITITLNGVTPITIETNTIKNISIESLESNALSDKIIIGTSIGENYNIDIEKTLMITETKFFHDYIPPDIIVPSGILSIEGTEILDYTNNSYLFKSVMSETHAIPGKLMSLRVGSKLLHDDIISLNIAINSSFLYGDTYKTDILTLGNDDNFPNIFNQFIAYGVNLTDSEMDFENNKELFCPSISNLLVPSKELSPADLLTQIKTVGGIGSGLDSDLLDGQQGEYYLNYDNLINKPTVTEMSGGQILTKLKTVDGVDSGLNADLLDGYNGSYYKNKLNHHEDTHTYYTAEFNVYSVDRSIQIGDVVSSNILPNDSVMIGYEAGGLISSTNTDGAVGIGKSACHAIQGQNIIGIGNSASYSNHGNNSIGLGYNALYGNRGSESIAIGMNSGESNLSNGAISIGGYTNYQPSNTFSNTICIGAGSYNAPINPTNNNQVRLGNQYTTEGYIGNKKIMTEGEDGKLADVSLYGSIRAENGILYTSGKFNNIKGLSSAKINKIGTNQNILSSMDNSLHLLINNDIIYAGIGYRNIIKKEIKTDRTNANWEDNILNVNVEYGEISPSLKFSVEELNPGHRYGLKIRILGEINISTIQLSSGIDIYEQALPLTQEADGIQYYNGTIYIPDIPSGIDAITFIFPSNHPPQKMQLQLSVMEIPEDSNTLTSSSWISNLNLFPFLPPQFEIPNGSLLFEDINDTLNNIDGLEAGMYIWNEATGISIHEYGKTRAFKYSHGSVFSNSVTNLRAGLNMHHSNSDTNMNLYIFNESEDDSSPLLDLSPHLEYGNISFFKQFRIYDKIMPEANEEIEGNLIFENEINVSAKIEKNMEFFEIFGKRSSGNIQDIGQKTVGEFWYDVDSGKNYECLIDNTDITLDLVEPLKWEERTITKLAEKINDASSGGDTPSASTTQILDFGTVSEHNDDEGDPTIDIPKTFSKGLMSIARNTSMSGELFPFNLEALTSEYPPSVADFVFLSVTDDAEYWHCRFRRVDEYNQDSIYILYVK